ncbi:MAG: hypothetical protein VKN13_07025 [Cyanobacteriota bacterium]|nr:hypothetical protein [Cyanobacteriota bacterium]
MAPPEPTLQAAAEPRYVRIGLVVAAVITSLAFGQLLVWPKLPMAEPAPTRLQGWTPQGVRPGRTDRHTSLSPTQRFETRTPAGVSLDLQLTTLAQAADTGIQVAAFTADQPALVLGQRQLRRLNALGQPLPDQPTKRRRRRPARVTGPLPPLREVALGQVQSQPALQTCLTPRGYGVTASGTQSLLFRQVTTMQDRWSYLMRSWPPRPHSCLLVTLRGPVEEGELLAAWSRLRPQLQPQLTE